MLTTTRPPLLGSLGQMGREVDRRPKGCEGMAGGRSRVSDDRDAVPGHPAGSVGCIWPSSCPGCPWAGSEFQ